MADVLATAEAMVLEYGFEIARFELCLWLGRQGILAYEPRQVDGYGSGGGHDPGGGG